jgi:hypothetical protein
MIVVLVIKAGKTKCIFTTFVEPVNMIGVKKKRRKLMDKEEEKSVDIVKIEREIPNIIKDNLLRYWRKIIIPPEIENVARDISDKIINLIDEEIKVEMKRGEKK